MSSMHVDYVDAIDLGSGRLSVGKLCGQLFEEWPMYIMTPRTTLTNFRTLHVHVACSCKQGMATTYSQELRIIAATPHQS